MKHQQTLATLDRWVIVDADGVPLARDDSDPKVFKTREDAARELPTAHACYPRATILRVELELRLNPRQQRKLADRAGGAE